MISILRLFCFPLPLYLPFSQDSIDQKRAEEYLDELLLSSSDPSNPLSASAGRTPSSSGRGRGGNGSGSEEEEEEEAERPLSSASSVSRKRAEWAMAKMYETDEEFRRSVDALIPEVRTRLPATHTLMGAGGLKMIMLFSLSVSPTTSAQAYELLLEGQLGAVLVAQLRGALTGNDGGDGA